MLSTQKKIFHSPKKAMLFVAEEFAMVLLLIYLAYKILGIQLSGAGIALFAKPVLFQNAIWFWTLLFLFIVSYFGIARRDEMVSKIHREFSGVIWAATKEKAKDTGKENLALIFAEFVFVIIIAFSIFIYLDPDINVVPAPYNYIAFIAFLAFSIFLYSKTRQFREAFYGPSLAKRAIMSPENHYSFRRVTSHSTGSIRIASKHHYDRMGQAGRVRRDKPVHRPAFLNQDSLQDVVESTEKSINRQKKAQPKRKLAKKR